MRNSVTLTSIGGISSDTTHSEEQALCRRIDVRKTSIVWCNQESFRFYTLLRRDCDEEHVTAYRQTVEMSTLVGREQFPAPSPASEELSWNRPAAPVGPPMIQVYHSPPSLRCR